MKEKQSVNYKFKFSVVMAVYNVEKYLGEALDSLIAQDIGFEKNVQVILVDDGTPDGSGEICDEYQKRYPDNIKVIHKENGGVSSARNEGLKHIEGRFVNFMDSDDVLEQGTLKEVYTFFDKVEGEVNLVSIPMVFFEGKTGDHALNYKYSSGQNEIVDLWKKYNYVQMSLSSAFITHRAAKQIHFDQLLKYAEDAALVMEILLKKCRYGVVPGGGYLYRTRMAGDSAISSSYGRKDWYINYLERFSLKTLKMYQQEYGYIPRFVQYTIMYDLQWRFRLQEIPEGVLTQEEEAYFRQLLVECLTYIDNQIILNQKYLTKEYMDYILSLKPQNKDMFWEEYFDQDLNLRCGNDPVVSMGTFTVILEILECTEKGFRIDGSVKLMTRMKYSDLKFIAEVAKENNQKQTIECSLFEHPGTKSISLGTVLADRLGFSVEIPFDSIQGITSVQFFMIVDHQRIAFKHYGNAGFFPLDTYYHNSYSYKNGYIFRINKNILLIEKADLIKRMKKELRLLREIRKTSLINKRSAAISKNPTKEELQDRKQIILWRCSTFLHQMFARKPIWLVSDRIDKADDNGEAFFAYLSAKQGPKPDVYFVISGKSPDYERLKKIGKVIDRDSKEYLKLFLKADVIVSAHAEAYITNPFDLPYSRAMRDLIRSKPFIFLQHGVIKDDISGWLNKYNKNISMFVTTTRPEYQSVLDCDYFYTEHEVAMTGLPRYDRLHSDPKKVITIMPTWRASLVSDIDGHTGQRTLIPGFHESIFYKMYEALFSDEVFLSKVEELGYKVRVLMHPNMDVAVSEFEISDKINMMSYDTPYRDIFTESDLIVTDYSSVAFDFVYLRKPVIYYQPDREEFFSGSHTYVQGYFDYDKDGFGEVCTDSEILKNTILSYLENGCTLKEMYKERVNHTFPYADKNNCERVYQRILKTVERVKTGRCSE